MVYDALRLYRLMLSSRRLEEEIARLWRDGLISGEMHLGIGEEAIVAGVVDHLGDGDAVAADHRSTPPLVMRGVDLAAIVSRVPRRRRRSRPRTGRPHAPDFEGASGRVVRDRRLARDRSPAASRWPTSTCGRTGWRWRSSARAP